MDFNLKLNEIDYIKFSCKNTDGDEIPFRAIVKSYNNRELFACTKNYHKQNFVLPQEVTLSFIYNDGLYSTKTNLKSTELDEPYTFFVFETPKNISYEQNREYFRVLAEYDCIYRIFETDKEYRAKTIDLSANGISLLLPTHEISEKDSEIQLIIGPKKINLRVQFIRSEKLENGYKLYVFKGVGKIFKVNLV